jgi:ribose/xylose/arabinose/galactoside ABC-type transport system permease subunit
MDSRLRSWREQLLGNRNLNLIVANVVVLILLAVFHPTFFSFNNLRVITLNMSAVGIAGIGMAYLIISRNVDLSVGSIYASTAFAAAWLALSVPPPFAFLGGLIVGGFLGLLNGLLVWRISISPIIATLGTLTIYRGMILVMTGGRGISGVPPDFFTLGRAVWFGISAHVWILLVLAILSSIVLSQTTIGRYIYAIGSNPNAAEVSGVRVNRFVVGLFTFNGIVVGIAGVLAASRFGTATVTFGVGFELDVITAVILGGVAFTGGSGNILGVMLAVLFLGIVNSGLVAVGVDPFWTNVVKGGALVISIGLEQITQEHNERQRRRIAIAEFAEQQAERARLDEALPQQTRN